VLESFLFKIKDHRRKQGQRYQLGHILLFAIFAILCDADSYRKIYAFIKVQYPLLNNIYQLNWKKCPAYTTIRNIIQGVSFDELKNAFREYSAALAAITPHQKRYIACDGKVLRGSFDHFQDQKAMQMFSAFLTDSNIIIAHEPIAEKTNEIPTAQQLIDALGLSNYIFTFDAMHCQQKTLETAVNTGNDVIVQVKENQKMLFNDCLNISATCRPLEIYDEPLHKNRNRIEQRTIQIFESTAIGDKDKWQLVKSVIKVERNRKIFDTKSNCWKNSDETSFYIATASLSAKTCGDAIRLHWGIENKNHYVRDVSMGEDQSRIRVNPHIFSMLRSFALNIMRINDKKNIQLELFNNCMNLTNVLKYVGIK
jgi:predicted transposase YbfD/YdcC